jgi:hypothetical protein
VAVPAEVVRARVAQPFAVDGAAAERPAVVAAQFSVRALLQGQHLAGEQLPVVLPAQPV